MQLPLKGNGGLAYSIYCGQYACRNKITYTNSRLHKLWKNRDNGVIWSTNEIVDQDRSLMGDMKCQQIQRYIPYNSIYFGNQRERRNKSVITAIIRQIFVYDIIRYYGTIDYERKTRYQVVGQVKVDQIESCHLVNQGE